uniref:THO complex 5 n=3 Tax=Crocodylus porosus TaxID=8502 RepID=A0A7M4EI67_CROPO
MSSDSSKKRKPKVIRTDGAAPDGKRSKADAEQDVKYYSEETEVDLRDPGKDYELYKETCEELQRLMAEIQDLKSKGSKDSVRRDLLEYCASEVLAHNKTLKWEN